MSVLDAFFGVGNDLDLRSLDPWARTRLEPWLERWQSSRGPAFLPRTHADSLFWYGLAQDAAQRRELQELLLHWVGPACSDAAIRRGALDLDDPFDARLEGLLPSRVVRLEVWPRASADDGHRAARDMVRGRLEGLVNALDRRPPRRRGSTVSLAALLDDLDLAATAGDAARTESLLKELESRRLLDAPNTTFVAVRVNSLLGRHDRVLSEDTLAALDRLRVPGGVALLVARSAYEEWMKIADEAQDTEALLILRREVPAGARHVVRQGPVSSERSIVVARAVIAGDEPGIRRSLLGVLPPDPHLRDLLDLSSVEQEQVPRSHTAVAHGFATEEAVGEKVPEESGLREVTSTTQPTSIDDEIDRLYDGKAFEALLAVAKESRTPLALTALEQIVMAAFELASPEAATLAIELVERDLAESPAEIEWSTRMVRVAVEGLLSIASANDVLHSWSAWFHAATAGADIPRGSLDGAADWPPLPADEFIARLEGLTNPTMLSPVMGRLRAAHGPLLDLQGRSRMARTLLAVLAFSDRPDASIRAATQDLVAEALDVGLSHEEAADLISTVRDLLLSQLSIGTVRWVIDVRSELGDALAVSHRDTLAAVDSEILRYLRPLEAAVPRTDWEALRALMKQVELDLPPDVVARLAVKEEADPLACLAGKRILIYSLRQRSARQAAARLRDIDEVEVTLSAVHGGSPQLARQVAGADLVVVVTAAAKHAATEFIEAAGPRELLRVNSAGMSSILTALEEVCLSSPA